ncbi:hypothetical protein NIES4075_31350 [Tolypothrix sp. NIES-4075]|uniref:hypothetical protein n=1 Tax=Tolypothrix sp. NIES-4075 TaxID=2005459 RepID=UPI000B5C5B2A|nr:hypothetical protein [Tolypothrix sp. NIES-4075]GAX42135.1 hypothetical protein NIES4075_31350 [Tolypothrix sp. NIES-4075]
MKKIALLTLSLSFLIILPATAQLGKVWTDFQSYSTDLQNYLTNNVNDSLKPVEFQSQNAIYNATGELRIPNPIDAGDRVSIDIFLNSISDKFENNPVVRSSLVNNEINRLITRSSAAGVLGVNGQIRSKTKLEDTENRLENLGVFADDPDEESNRLLKQFSDLASSFTGMQATTALSQLIGLTQSQNTVKIQREQVKIVAETLGQTIQTNQSLQYTNLNLASLSQQMEDTNRARRVDASAEAARLLRTTSQADLFGRKLNN